MASSIQNLISSLKSYRQSLTLPKKIQAYFLEALADLLEEGFSLQQALHFMSLLLSQQDQVIDHMLAELSQGRSLDQVLKDVGLDIDIVSQLFFAQKQGRFIDSLKASSQLIFRIQAYRKQLVKALVYPCFMSLFLLGLMFGMRAFLLPHISSFLSQDLFDRNIWVRLLILFFSFLPQWMALLGAAGIFSYLGLDLYLSRLTPLARYQKLNRLPLLGRWTQAYCTYKLARDLGHFYGGGYAISQITLLWIQYPVDPFLTEIAQAIHTGMEAGYTLPDILKELNVFTPVFATIIYQGELTSQTARKCQLYSDKLFKDLLEDIQRKIRWIQPLLFILIALLVLAMYLLMMLPMLTMEGL